MFLPTYGPYVEEMRCGHERDTKHKASSAEGQRVLDHVEGELNKHTLTHVCAQVYFLISTFCLYVYTHAHTHTHTPCPVLVMHLVMRVSGLLDLQSSEGNEYSKKRKVRNGEKEVRKRNKMNLKSKKKKKMKETLVLYLRRLYLCLFVRSRSVSTLLLSTVLFTTAVVAVTTTQWPLT